MLLINRIQEDFESYFEPESRPTSRNHSRVSTYRNSSRISFHQDEHHHASAAGGGSAGSPISIEETEERYPIPGISSGPFVSSQVDPIYERAKVAPTRAATPMQQDYENNTEKKVRFLESEVSIKMKY